jgi:hypothetical protein
VNTKLLSAAISVFICLAFPRVVSAQGQSSPQAVYSDDGSIHSLGNGIMCIYERGTNITTAYTGPYSTPSFLSLEWINDPLLASVAYRKPGTAIWLHKVYTGKAETGELVDFVDAEIPCFVRHVKTDNRLIFRIKLEHYVQIIDNSDRLYGNRNMDGLLLVIPPGTTIYQTYVYPRILYNQIIAGGMARFEQDLVSGTVDIICEPGESTFYLVGGPEYPDVINYTRQICETSTEVLLNRTNLYWNNFTRRRKDFNRLLPENTPSRDRLLQTIDDVAVLLKTQQSIQGAVLAGYPYPLGYVRDQYGVSRGMLTLGLQEEARAILNFYWQIWKKYGFIHNAQAIGLDGIFHIHENDEVESTGYLILQSFDLFQISHDTAFLKEITPMLEWAFDSQKKHLVNGMLPFNGDETYVAGGILPRSALNDGSAEATMLFIESGQKLLDWLAANQCWPADRITENRSLLSLVGARFGDNFWKDGILWTNNPSRALSASLPQFRHGVCEKQGPGCLMVKYNGIVWTERNENNRYLCAGCISAESLPKAEPKMYNLLSTSLAPFYMRFHVLPDNQLKNAVVEIRDNFIKTGAMTSKEEMIDQGDVIHTVGYDYGFLLTALTALDMKEASLVYAKTLSVVDREGSWSEYYLNDQPSGTRCRPWESAINLEALINLAVKAK